jgi:membrane protein DedA with SNARE-associated domain
MREWLADLARTVLGAVTSHAYVTLFFAISVEEAGIPLPFPGDLVIAYYGWRAKGDPYEIVQTILVCALASTAGTQVPYWLSRRFGRRVTERAAGWLDIDMARVERLLAWVDRHGFLAVLVARLIPGLRVAASLVAGTARVPPLAFAAAVFVAGTIYWTVWVLLGALLGPKVEDLLDPSFLPIIIVGIPLVVIVAFVVRAIVTRRRRGRR